MAPDRIKPNARKSEKRISSSHENALQTISDLEETIEQKNRIIGILRETIHHYRTIAELSPHAIFIIDTDGFIQYVNCYAAELLKCSAGNIIGKPLRSLFPPETFELQKKNLNIVFEKKEPFHHQDKIVFPGSELWLDTHLIPLHDKDGTVSAVLGIASDITEMRERRTKATFMRGVSQGVISPNEDNDTLTQREKEILKLIASGFTNREIASQLFISIKTVDTHRTRILKKLGAKNTAELVRHAINLGVV